MNKATAVGIAFVALFLAGAAARGQEMDNVYIGPAESASVKDAETAAREVKRIESRDIPALPELVLDEVRYADQRVQTYGAMAARQFKAPDLSGTRAAALASAAALLKKPCVESVAATKLDELRAEMRKYNAAVPMQTLAALSLQADALPQTPAQGQRLADFLDPRPFNDPICRVLQSATDLESMLKDHFGYWEQRMAVAQRVVEQQGPLALKLAAAWKQRKDSLTKLVQDQRASSIQSFISYLPYIVLTFCLFGLAVISVIRIFPSEVQMEWVASGQVIQFASVMVLLIVVSSLGLLHILEKEGIGTLLGAIGGYVLSQGVGRAAARAASAQGQTAPAPSGVSAPAKNPEYLVPAQQNAQGAATPSASPQPSTTPDA